jgi:hypothetical protein
LGDVVHRSYSSELAAFDIATFILENQMKMAGLQQQLIQKYFPNLLKLVACHPTSLVEEFIELVPIFVVPATAVEVLCLYGNYTVIRPIRFCIFKYINCA